MASLPVTVEQLIEQFGPHPMRIPPGGWAGQTWGEPDKLVATLLLLWPTVRNQPQGKG